jgi:uncharacterized protein (TIGR03032 family)
MSKRTPDDLDLMWSRHHAEWRDPSQIASQWREATEVDPELLRCHARGRWWETLFECGITLLVTREYEHLVMALRSTEKGPVITYLPLPHPSGLVVNRGQGVVHIASTRNPNQVYTLAPATGLLRRHDVEAGELRERPLVPVHSRFFPGSLYLHDLAVIGGRLYANAVGQNAVVRLEDGGRVERVWWPRCVETDQEPAFDRNHLQLNSIAAGATLKTSFFSASTDVISARRPGHQNFPVDRRGVIFSGATREVMATGLTRPHSARLHSDRLWVDNSGYGEFGFIEDGSLIPVTKLPGWTRGLCFKGGIAFVGTSRVIPRFRQYAPGLNIDESVCGIHAVEFETGRVLGSLVWRYGNQIFALDWLPAEVTSGFPFAARRRAAQREKVLFYSFITNQSETSVKSRTKKEPARRRKGAKRA